MALTGKIDDSKLKLALQELNTWCMNYQGNIGMVFSEQVTIEKKIVKLFWCVKQSLDQGVALTDGYNKLYDYVNNYFANLDIQKEIDKKLEEMVKDGTLEQIINQEIFGKLNSKIDALNTFTNDLIEGGKKIMFVGDSIAAGFGWWIDGSAEADRPGKEGVMSVLQEMYPNNTYTNLAKNGACLGRNGNQTDSLFNMRFTQEQDYLFIMCGINDVTNMNGSVDTLGTYYNYLEQEPTQDWNVAYGALYSYLYWCSYTHPNMKIIFVTEPNTEYNYFKYLVAFEKYKEICSLFGAYVIDIYNIFPKYSTVVFNYMYHDRVHPNENGYRLMTNIIIKALNGEPIERFNNVVKPKVLVVYAPALLNTGTEELSQHVTYFWRFRQAIPNIINALDDQYYNDDFVLNPGNDNFINIHVEHNYQGPWFITFYPFQTYRFPITFKSISGVVESENRVFMAPTTRASGYGITAIHQFPVSGIFYGSVGDFSDLPTGWTKTLNVIIIAHVDIDFSTDNNNPYSGYKWIEVIPYGSTERFYCRWIKNSFAATALIDYFTDTGMQPYNP